MRIPLVVYIGAAVEAAPPLAALVARQALRGVRGWVLLWCSTLILFDATELVLALAGIHNAWVSYVLNPVSGVIVLWALSLWQATEVPRLTMRLVIIPFAFLSVLLTLAFDNTSTFSRAAAPMSYLMCLAASAYTLVTLSLSSSTPLWRQDWFWVSAGMAMYFAVSSLMGPVGALLVVSAPTLLVRALEVKSLFLVASFLAIARGVTCPSST